MSKHRPHFYDSAAPGNIPSGVLAGVYVNSYPWTDRDIRRMRGVFGISERPEASYAKYARCIAVEPGAASPGDVVPFLRYRLELGHHDGTAYVNRSNYDEVRTLVNDAGLHARYWVATLDGTMEVEGAWAVQYWGGGNAPYDLSILYGVEDFTPPRHFRPLA